MGFVFGRKKSKQQSNVPRRALEIAQTSSTITGSLEVRRQFSWFNQAILRLQEQKTFQIGSYQLK